MTLALECVYAHTGVDQFDKATEILRTLPERHVGWEIITCMLINLDLFLLHLTITGNGFG